MARTENLTIMFTDVVDYTQRTSGQSRGQLRELLRRCRSILLPLIRRYGGWQVKNLGDALLIAFRSPTDALRCGMAQHDAVAASNRGLPKEQHVHIRIAVALGEVLVQDRDVFGEAVNLAARLENVTPADHLYFTEAVYLAMNKAEVPSQLVGTETFKGIPEPVRIYQVPVRQVSRLVPAGEPLASPEPELPFGGAHLVPVEVGLRMRMQGRLQGLRQSVPPRRVWLWALPVPLIALALWAAWPLLQVVDEALPPPADAALPAPAPTRGLLIQARPLLEQGQYEQVRVLYRARLASRPNDAEALLLQGHDLFQQDRRKEGVAAYEKALAADPALREDGLLARNLARALSWASEEAIPLIRRYSTPALIDALVRRTAEPAAARGRARAADLLTELGQAGRIDRGGMAWQDLREATTCEERLAAVQRLRPLKERRARPDLEALLEGGMKGWWEHRCVRDAARAALDELGAESAKACGGPHPDPRLPRA